ncbi:hypothetical protein N7468_003829 [Penicillium chermesinum]|uniref:Major facilitator superfamily (MFS) profile domain-containing protein n=1 Tax=Penicillium chermesinum TaxID=63820 RepID=A0A9W9P7D4_9EURO|nr:uncharacterized protein N7468_003829 [Penicillium chermesinum]KAJ5239210.1 hypothetical protein N7468_003829 [Penicillium chermesinum]
MRLAPLVDAETPPLSDSFEKDDIRQQGQEDTDVESAPNQQAAEKPTEKDPNLVEWDGPDDPDNPQNFPKWRKWVITVSMSFMTVWITFASSVFSAANQVTSKEFHVSSEVMVLGTSLMVFGFALGPIVWAPMSELYGRRLPLFSGYTVFAIFQIPVAVATNLQSIMIFRFLMGFFGCSPLACVGGAMADIWNPCGSSSGHRYVQRSYIPWPDACGGFITESHLGWRWTAWITLIAASFFGIIALIIIPETYGPRILQDRAARLRRETKNGAYHSFLDEHKPTIKDLVYKYLLRPFQMLALEPILVCMTLYLALVYGILYLFFEAYPISFAEVRGWTNIGVASLPFIGIMVGVLCGVALIVFTTKTRYARKHAAQGRVAPEERLVPMMVASILLPIGLFWFGWTSNKNIHWAPQVIAGVPIGLGILVIFMQGLNYIIDVYMMFANSAIAANTLVRSTVGGGFPLFATGMYHNLGVPWASSTLAFISVAMIPIPFLFYIYGAKIRSFSRFTPKF